MTQYDVLLIGRTPVAAVLVRQLARSGRVVALINDGMAPISSGSIRWRTLRDTGLGDQPDFDNWQILQELSERVLLEDGSLDAIYRSDRLNERANRFLAIDSERLIDLCLDTSVAVDSGAAAPVEFLRGRGRVAGVRFDDGSEIEARLTIVTSGNRLLLGATDRSLPDGIAPPFLEQVQITWEGRSGTVCRQSTVTGGPLAEVGAMATLLSLPDRVTLSVTVPAGALVREAVVISDIIASLLRHPSFSDLPPLSSALSANVRLLTLPARVKLDRYRAGCWVLGPMDGLSDPVSFDRELSLAHELGAELGGAPVERLGTVSLSAAISAIIGSADWAQRRLRGVTRRVDADWVLDDPDRLGQALARMARHSPIE